MFRQYNYFKVDKIYKMFSRDLKLVCNDGVTIVFILSGTIEDTLSKFFLIKTSHFVVSSVFKNEGKKYLHHSISHLGEANEALN